MWGAGFFFTAVQVESLPPLTIVALRVGLAAVALLGWAVIKRVDLPGPATWPAFLGLALLNNVLPFALYAFAQRTIPSGLVAILNATAPLWSVLVAHLATKDERATLAKLVGVVLGAAGVGVMVGIDALAAMERGLGEQIACLVAALCYALAALWSRRFVRAQRPPVAIATAQLCAAALIIAPLAMAVDRPWTLFVPGPRIWAATAGAALFSTVLAYIVYFRLIARIGASGALLVTFTVPIVSILLGASFLGEALLLKHGVGMLLIAAGLVVIDGRLARGFRRRRAS